jgi:hypothetical protein
MTLAWTPNTSQSPQPSSEMAIKRHTSANGTFMGHRPEDLTEETHQSPSNIEQALIIGKGTNATTVTTNHHSF